MDIRSSLAGASATLSSISFALGAFAQVYPTSGILGPFARILDALSPLLFVVGLVFAILVVVLGGRLIGGALAVVNAASGLVLFWAYLATTLPAQASRDPTLRVVFFNAEEGNVAFSERIVSAALDLDPDFVVFVEASAVLPSLDRLKTEFRFVSPCTATECELLVATNLEIRRFWSMQINPLWPDRYAVLEFETWAGDSAFLAASHLTKPWISEISISEIARLTAQYNWFDGPVIAVGDYNMPPWSRPMRQLLNETGFRAFRWQPPTWPNPITLASIPIDQVLTRGGATVASVVPFGDDLNSNHRGFVAEISIPSQR